MLIYFLAFLLVLISIIAMSVGVMISGKRIQGSCGGLGAALVNEQGQKVCGYCGITYDSKEKITCGKA